MVNFRTEFCINSFMQKTKPTQHSVRELRALGLTPHFLACRSAQVSLRNLLKSVRPWKTMTSPSYCKVLTCLNFFCSAATTGTYKGKIVSVLSCGGITCLKSTMWIYLTDVYLDAVGILYHLLTFFRLLIFSISMMFQTFGMFHFYSE